MNEKQNGWGLCMEGNEELFTACLERASARLGVNGPKDRFNYMEIGFGGGQTMAAVGRVLRGLDRPFQLTGYDLADGWSMDRALAERLLKEEGFNFKLHLESGRVGLARAKQRLNIDLAFIDGCHGAPCVVADFIAVAGHMRSGGMVLFHDASVSCQGYHMQPHCGTGIDVRAGLNQLGLIEDWLPGWKFKGEARAPHGIVAVEYVGE